MTKNGVDLTQKEVCARYGVRPFATKPNDKLGIARNVRDRVWPVNGLRHPPEAGTSGWFIYAGLEPSTDPDYFMPLHAQHVSTWCPEVIPFLALPPGWRFLVAPGYEDVWFDASLLEA